MKGGTLTMGGVGDIDHIDSAAWYYSTDYIFGRMVARQLVTYPTSADQRTSATIAADAATEVPSKSNGGISQDGKTYTFHIRQGVKWSTSPARQVTAEDFVRGIARTCNPVAPFGATYFSDTIEGFDTFCQGELKAPGTAEGVASYLKAHMDSIPGMKATDASTIVFKLKAPANDFLNMVALQAASAAPVEYLQYKPDSPELAKNFISDGPYKLDNWDPARSMSLSRNPAWDPKSDPIRKAYVDKVEVNMALTQESVQQQLQAGSLDMEWDTFPPPAQVPQLQSTHDAGLNIGSTSSSNPYIVFDMISPTAGGALGKTEVRQAISYAVNKGNIIQSLGGPALNNELNQVLPPSINGYQKFNLYPYNVNKAKQMLAAAGYPNGLTLKLLYRNASIGSSKAAETLQADLAKAGIKLQLLPATNADFYGKYLQVADVAQRGTWDMALAGWGADWTGNAARTYFSPLFDGRAFAPTSSNFGHYNDPKTNQLIDQALAAPTPEAAASIWHQADMQVMKDAPFVPLTNPKQANYYNTKRVHNWIYVELFQQGDPTMVWVK